MKKNIKHTEQSKKETYRRNRRKSEKARSDSRKRQRGKMEDHCMNNYRGRG